MTHVFSESFFTQIKYCLTKEKSTHWLTNHKHRLRLYNILIQVYRFADENTVLHTIKTIKQFRL